MTTWRVECTDAVREVPALRDDRGRIVTRALLHVEMRHPERMDERAAVATYAAGCGWPVVSVLAPGEMTRAELAAEVERLTAERGDEEDRMDKAELLGFLDVCRARARALRDMLDAILTGDPAEFRRCADKHGQDLEHEDRARLNGITSALPAGDKFPTLHVHESEGVDA